MFSQRSPRTAISTARARLPFLCGRDPGHLDGDGLARAVVESVAENTSDAVVAALVWAAVAGPAGVVAHRCANTLDAMVGHRSPRHERFGWAAARLDDVVGWAPARLTALLAIALAPAVGGSPAEAWQLWRAERNRHPSPNAGQAEAAFAGALGTRLGGRSSRSVTKLWGLAGVRAGYLLAPPGIVARCEARRQPWPVSQEALVALEVCAGDDRYRREVAKDVQATRTELIGLLAELPRVRVWPSAANFLLLQVPEDAQEAVRSTRSRGRWVRGWRCSTWAARWSPPTILCCGRPASGPAPRTPPRR